MSTPVILLLGAVVAATALGMYNAILGGFAGIFICLGVGVWGFTEMEAGATIAFFGKPLDKTTFLALIGVLTAINAVQIVRGFWRRKRSRFG